jgi:hypothetical protein
MEQYWHGISNPWHQFIGKRFGKYTLFHYHNLPNDDPSNIPPSYEFSLSDPDHNIVKIKAFNILQLEQCCLESYGSSYKLSLYGSPKHAVGNIIDNNIANGVSSEGVVYDDSDTFLFKFTNKTDYYKWWESRYGESSVGTDRNYVLINYP